MKTEIVRIAVCPKCGNVYFDFPALSRIDNITPICSDCGFREALESIGVPPEEQEKYIAVTHRARATWD